MKKAMACLLALVMLFSLAACGDSAASSAPEPSGSVMSSQETGAEAPAEPTPEPAAPVEDSSEGAEGSAEEPPEDLAAQPEETAPTANLEWPDAPLTLTMWTHANDGFFTDISVLDSNPCLVQAEEDTNIHIDVNAVSRSVAADQFSLMIAGGDYPDMINRFVTYYTGSIADAVEQEIILDLSDYLETNAPNYYALAQADPDFFKDMKTDEGVVATLYAMTTYADGGPISGGYIRQDWLDELGMDSPVTYDEYHEVLTAFKNNYGCLSPMLLTSDIYPDNYCMIAGYDVSSGYYVRDGKVCYGPMEDNYRDYLKMMAEWYSEGLIASDFTSISGGMSNDYLNYVGNDDTGLFFHMARQDDSWNEYVDNSTTAIAAVQDAVKNKGNQTHLGFAERLIGNDGISISTGCDPDHVPYAVQWMDYWYSDEGITMVNYGIEGLTFEYDANGDPQYTDMIVNNPDGLNKVQAQFAYCLIHLVPSKNTAAQSIISADHTTWGTNKDGSYELPTTLSMTPEEGIRYNQLSSDIDTYVEEMTLKFMTGQSDIDAEWDAYVANLEGMSVSECISIVQAEYDRYQAR